MYLSFPLHRLRTLGDLLNHARPKTWSTSTMTEDDWAKVVELANHHRLTPTLYDELRATKELGDLPDAVRRYLLLLYRSNSNRNSAIRRQVGHLVSVLEKAGCRPIFLKGTACLFDSPYASTGARMIGDIDLLIALDTLAPCITALQGLGYRVIRRYPATHNAFGDLVKDGEPAAIDVHVQPIDSPHILWESELRAKALPVRCARSSCLIPNRTYRVLHNLLHAEVHDAGGYYHARLALRDLHEFAVMCDAFDGDIDWDFVTRRMEQHGMATVLESYAFAAGEMFGAQCPVRASESIRARLHHLRQLAQARFAWLEQLCLPWSNLRAAFAHHRMKAFYGQSGGGPVVWRIRHGRRYLAKSTLGLAKGRLLRV